MRKSRAALAGTKASLTIVALLGMLLCSATNTAADSKLRRWTELNWGHREVALLTIFGPFASQPDAAEVARARPALEIHDLREVILANDDKGITLVLTENDRRAFARLVQRNTGKWMAAIAPPKDIYRGAPVAAVTHIQAEMAGGRIVLPHPQCAPIAENLRRRLGLAEFPNSRR